MRWKLPLLALALAGAGLTQVEAASGPPARSAPDVAAAAPASDDARRVAAKIDEIIAAELARAGGRAAPVCDDLTFLRRASLDISGKIPVVNDARRFLSDGSPEKRAAAIEKLLESPGYVNHMTTKWLELLVPEAQADFQSRYL